MKVTRSERGVENGAMSRVTCTERVGGGLSVVVHGRGSGLARGLSEMQREMRTLVWLGGHRGGVELEVVCLGLCQGKGEGRERESTPEADWWGGLLCTDTCMTSGGEEVKEMGEDLCKILACNGSGSSSPSLFSKF
jgi:hypothetical protein